MTARTSENPALFVIVQLNTLGEINDSFGHKAGDSTLACLADRLCGLDADAVVGRLSGSRFALLLPYTSNISPEEILQAMRSSISKPWSVAGREITLRLTVGAVCIPAETVHLTEALQYADSALQKAKREKVSFVIFDREMLKDLKLVRLLQRELRAAILLDELSINYQPIIDTSGTIIGLEALLRWESPSRGPISPARFIPIAEQSFLIDQLGEWVLRKACLDARSFSPLHVAVNVSASQLRRDDIVEMVARVLRETGHPPARLVLELTESVALETTPDIQRRMAALRDMGIHISLDDFGTGFSGFEYLRNLPIDSIKIDRSYISKLGSSEPDNVLVSALASVAGAMQLDVLAEGVETEEQLMLAKAAGCRLFQGYHIARPMTKTDVLRVYDLAA